MHAPSVVLVDGKRCPLHIVTKIDLVNWLIKRP